MNKIFKIPPKSKNDLTPPEKLAETLRCLIGKRFNLTGKTRTDGSNMRKLIAYVLEQSPLPIPAEDSEYEIIPHKRKGIPKITREFIDTYIVTTGTSYNLQVWNRIPSNNPTLISFGEDSLKSDDVRFVIVRVNTETCLIDSILILTSDYIVEKFGKFGKPTKKYQMLIPNEKRKKIINSPNKILCFKDTARVQSLLKHEFEKPKHEMTSKPSSNEIFSLEIIKSLVATIIGQKLQDASTKNRGQLLERKVFALLGYNETDLYGGYPDVPNQILEIKIQDSPTVDLGKFSPEFEETIVEELSFTTRDIRYLIALTHNNIIEGIILSPGEMLGDEFSYVSDESFKCQRAIRMSFFDKYSGKSVFNPD